MDKIKNIQTARDIASKLKISYQYVCTEIKKHYPQKVKQGITTILNENEILFIYELCKKKLAPAKTKTIKELAKEINIKEDRIRNFIKKTYPKKMKRSVTTYLTIEECDTIKKYFDNVKKTDIKNTKVKTSDIEDYNAAIELLKKHPEGLGVFEIKEKLSLKKDITKLLVIDKNKGNIAYDKRIDNKYYYTGELPKMKKIPFENQKEIIRKIKQSKTGLSLKEIAEALQTNTSEARRLINSFMSKENIECVLSDGTLKYIYAGF